MEALQKLGYNFQYTAKAYNKYGFSVRLPWSKTNDKYYLIYENGRYDIHCDNFPEYPHISFYTAKDCFDYLQENI